MLFAFFLHQLPAKRQCAGNSITDCPAKPHLHVLVKVKKIVTKRSRHACVETQVSLVKANMVHRR